MKKQAKSIIRKIFHGTISIVKAPQNQLYTHRALKYICSQNPPYRLHLGCGNIRLDNWINIDINKTKAVDFTWDITERLPFCDNSCELIYNEHVLEHLAIAEGTSFLRECHRVLQKDGILRIAMPSLEDLIKSYNNKIWNDADWLSWPQYQFIKTKAEMLNIAFRWWGHQWLYDGQELIRRLKDVGFQIIQKVEWGKSNILALQNLESRKDSKLICEAFK